VNDVDVDGILCTINDKIDSEVLDCAGPRLRVISTISAGIDHINVDELRARSILLGHTPDVLTDATADTTVLLALAAARRIKESVRAVGDGSWGSWGPTWLLGETFVLGSGFSASDRRPQRTMMTKSFFGLKKKNVTGTQFTNKTLGIVGLGRVGTAVAQRLKAFGIGRVLYYGRREKPEVAERLSAIFTSFDTLLKESDVVCACTALTNDTKGMFDYEAFARMKSTAIFVNTARGGIVNQDDLARALNEKLIFAAGLDVTTPEPLPTSSPLLRLDNCIVTPHIGSATWQTRTEMGIMAVANLVAGLRGNPLTSPAM